MYYFCITCWHNKTGMNIFFYILFYKIIIFIYIYIYNYCRFMQIY